jgi:hypothetical protein
MTAPFQWRQPVTPEVINYVAQHMRESDKRELEAFGLFALVGGRRDASALARLLVFWVDMDSQRGAIAITDEHGVPAGICGCNGQTIWMLGTKELTSTREHRRLLVVEGRKWVEELLTEGRGPLHNYCLADNKESIRWLKALGFAFAEPQPMGPSGRLFRYFWRNN